jgi:hypothetical protein
MDKRNMTSYVCEWMDTVRGAARMVCAGFLLTAALSAQQQIPLVNGPANGNDASTTLEVEQIEIFRLTALPSSITRPPGPFVLMLLNKTGDPNASFFVRAVAPGPESTVGAVAPNPAPVLAFQRQTPEVKHRRAGVLDLSKGRYELLSSPANKVLCTITIE